MQLSHASSYALHALTILAGQKNGISMASHLIARAEGIPEKFLLKILNPLARAGLLRSIKGPHGGYWLAKPANEVTLLEVVEAVDGPIRGQVPPAEGKGDPGLHRRIAQVYQQLADHARRQLTRITIADLARKGK
jgi:Rrf2 family protein